MGNTYYIAAIELSSSKISGAVSMETTEGMKILAAASTPVEGFITKGVVRNIVETSKAINYIINELEQKLREKYDVDIKRAYTSLAGLSMKSVGSKVTKGYEDYTRISEDTVDSLAIENETTFHCPDGFVSVGTIKQEYKLDGKMETMPVGTAAKIIEGNYLNLIFKEQFQKQLNDSFAEAKLIIEDSSCAACIDADIILSEDTRRNGCALVNIGADTTTISIYTKGILRMLNVLPIGSSNITRDLCAEHVSYNKAEEIKITRGYKPGNNESGTTIDAEKADEIICARMSEILQNVKARIEGFDGHIQHIIFTGGGSKLKNLNLLLDETLPNFRNEIVSEPKFNIISDNDVNTSCISATLYGLLKQGKANCCEKEVLIKETPKPVVQTTIFTNEEEEQEEQIIENDELAEKRRIEEEERKRREQEEREREKERKKEEKEAERQRKIKEKEEKKKNKKPNAVVSLFKQWFEEASEEDEGDNDND